MQFYFPYSGGNISRNLLVTLLLFALNFSAFAQVKQPAVKVQALATNHSIKLRWAPDSPSTWRLANQRGYTIERIQLAENGKVVSKPSRKILNDIPIKPAPEQFWERFLDGDDYVAVAAQAIFGEAFEIENSSSSIIKVVTKARDLESRFSFALFSADQSIKAAELSGLYFEDEMIAPESKYLYKIYANIPTEILPVDTGFVYVGLMDYRLLPKPIDLQATFEDRVVMLRWNAKLFEKIYNSYRVERSADNGHSFQRITEQPIINTFSGKELSTPFMFRADSLPTNNIKYHYRVIGINTFGEVGPPSDTVSGMGRSVFGFNASIIQHEINAKGEALLKWVFPVEGETMLSSFDLLRMQPSTKVYKEVKLNIDRRERVAVDQSPSGSNYYIIRSKDRYGRRNNSFPYLVQTIDSIGPAAPVELTGRIDTLGRVFLKWQQNSEPDIEGYAVYKANFTTDEFIQEPGPIQKENVYIDTIELETLTEKIYYKVISFDKRFNPSAFSKILALEKPDKIPPVSPVFSEIRSDSSGIHLSWKVSGSEDVEEHLLYRKSENEETWTLLKAFSKTDTLYSYLDKVVKHNLRYAYTMLALDDDGLESLPAMPFSLAYIAPEPYPMVDKIFYTVDKTKKLISLSWVYSQPQIDKFLIYRSKDGQPLKLFTSLDPEIGEFKDQYNLSDSEIQYRIAVSFKSGEKTRMTKPIIIKI